MVSTERWVRWCSTQHGLPSGPDLPHAITHIPNLNSHMGTWKSLTKRLSWCERMSCMYVCMVVPVLLHLALVLWSHTPIQYCFHGSFFFVHNMKYTFIDPELKFKCFSWNNVRSYQKTISIKISWNAWKFSKYMLTTYLAVFDYSGNVIHYVQTWESGIIYSIY